MEEENIDKIMQSADLQALANQQTQQQMQSSALNYYIQEQERTIAEAQLEVDSILTEIYHILRQDVIKSKENGDYEWVPIKDKTQRVLTDYGVDKIMQVMKIYINKNVLLSNFSEEQIKKRMLNFCLSLNSNIFMKYEIYFREPTLEEVQNILKERLKKRKEIKIFALKMINAEVDEEKIEKEIMKEIENRVEYELEKIKQEVRRRNLREYELLFRQLEAMVEATHNRAWRGEERGSLRRHMTVSEIVGSQPQTSKQKGGLFKWVKG